MVFGIRKVLQGRTGSRATCCATWWTTTARGGQPQRQQTLLTAREQEIVRHLMTGPPTPDRRQPVRERTHRQIHLYNVFKKLNVKNRLQAVSWAKEYL